MKNRFEEGRARMSAEERDGLWSRVADRTIHVDGTSGERSGRPRPIRRSFPLWRIWTPMAVGAAASVVMVMTMWDKAPTDAELRQAARLEPPKAEGTLAAEPVESMEQSMTAGADELVEDVAVESGEAVDAVIAPSLEGTENEGEASVDAAGAVPEVGAAQATPDTNPVAKSDATQQVAAPEGTRGVSAPAERPARIETPKPLPSPVAADSLRALLEELDAQPNEIVGRVVDQNGKPVPYASVVVEGTQWGAMSLDDGSFRISGVPDGTYRLRSLIIGYTDDEQTDVNVGEEPAAVMFQVEEATLGALSEVEVSAAKEQIYVKSTDTSHEIESSPSPESGRGGRGSPKTRMFDGSDRNEKPGVVGSVPYVAGSPVERGAEPSERVSARRARDVTVDPGEKKDGSQIRGDAFSFSMPPFQQDDDDMRRVRPKDAPYDAVYYRDYGANPLVWTDRDALSTFAVDVDNGSYTIARRYVEDGHLPEPASVRVEEFVNYFGPGYPEFDDTDFRIYADGSPSPFRDGFELVRIGLQARTVDESERPTARLTFVVDVSGSMGRENRLGLVRQSLHMLVDRLRDDDEVALVAYGSTAEIVLRPTSARNEDEIDWAIERLVPNGSTNAEDGLRLGYEMAGRMYEKGAINRILLCSDGVANVGRTGPEAILRTVRSESDRGIYLTTIGFGMGNYNDVLMEQLADQGDGAYYYVDQYDEAERVLVRELTGTLLTVARDAKIQVEFDRETVEAYRLIGFENRDVADRDFRNDSIDAGEIGSGHSVVALYEVKLRGDRAREVGEGRERRLDFGRDRFDLATVRLRYALPDRESRHGDPVVREISREVSTADLSESFGRAPLRFRLAAVVGQYAEILRNSYWAQDMPLADLARDAKDVAFYLRDDDQATEFARLVERAADIQDRMSIAERERWWPRMEAHAPDYPPRRGWRR